MTQDEYKKLIIELSKDYVKNRTQIFSIITEFLDSKEFKEEFIKNNWKCIENNFTEAKDVEGEY